MVCYHLKGADIVIIMFDFTNYASTCQHLSRFREGQLMGKSIEKLKC